MGYVKAACVNLTILLVWYITEYLQFGTLQHERICDTIVGALYILVITHLFCRIDQLERKSL